MSDMYIIVPTRRIKPDGKIPSPTTTPFYIRSKAYAQEHLNKYPDSTVFQVVPCSVIEEPVQLTRKVIV